MSNIDLNEGRRGQILNITNCGALVTKQAEDIRYKFAGWYFGLQGTKTSHLFGNNIVTIDGRLYWAVEYFPHVTTMTQAEEVFDSTLEVIKQACMEWPINSICFYNTTVTKNWFVMNIKPTI